MKKNYFILRNFHRLRLGFTLIDGVLALFVVSVMVAVFGGFATAHTLSQHVSDRAQAAALADEQLNALKRMDVTTLSSQTNGSFKNVLYNAGSWKVISDGGDQVVELAINSAVTNGVSGRLLLPAAVYDNGTIQANIKIMADSPSGSSVGFFLRSADSANGYRLRVARTGTDLYAPTSGTNENVLLEKIVSGTVTAVYYRVSTVTISSDTWYTIKANLNSGVTNTMNIFIGGNQQDTNTINDISFGNGAAAILGWNGVHAEVDDVQTVVNSVTSTWSFENSTTLPAAWIRLGLNDLADNTSSIYDDNGLLTIAPYPNVGTNTTLKQATITIQWRAKNGMKNYSTSSLIGRSGLGL